MELPPLRQRHSTDPNRQATRVSASKLRPHFCTVRFAWSHGAHVDSRQVLHRANSADVYDGVRTRCIASGYCRNVLANYLSVEALEGSLPLHIPCGIFRSVDRVLCTHVPPGEGSPLIQYSFNRYCRSGDTRVVHEAGKVDKYGVSDQTAGLGMDHITPFRGSRGSLSFNYREPTLRQAL